jgi:hypothetical protein
MYDMSTSALIVWPALVMHPGERALVADLTRDGRDLFRQIDRQRDERDLPIDR